MASADPYRRRMASTSRELDDACAAWMDGWMDDCLIVVVDVNIEHVWLSDVGMWKAMI